MKAHYENFSFSDPNKINTFVTTKDLQIISIQEISGIGPDKLLFVKPFV